MYIGEAQVKLVWHLGLSATYWWGTETPFVVHMGKTLKTFCWSSVCAPWKKPFLLIPGLFFSLPYNPFLPFSHYYSLLMKFLCVCSTHVISMNVTQTICHIAHIFVKKKMYFSYQLSITWLEALKDSQLNLIVRLQC